MIIDDDILRDSDHRETSVVRTISLTKLNLKRLVKFIIWNGSNNIINILCIVQGGAGEDGLAGSDGKTGATVSYNIFSFVIIIEPYAWKEKRKEWKKERFLK